MSTSNFHRLSVCPYGLISATKITVVVRSRNFARYDKPLKFNGSSDRVLFFTSTDYRVPSVIEF